MNYEHLNLYTDGGARGNPGPAAAGYVIKDDDGALVQAGNKYLGETTNNQAEYNGLILGLQEVINLNAESVSIYMDSELIVKQLQRKYKVKNEGLAILFVKAWNLTLEFKKVDFTHIVREKNKEADSQVNKALDARINI
jgi:ribonuclease HI